MAQTERESARTKGTDVMLAVPNFSEGRRPEVIEAIGAALGATPGVRLLDRQADADHNRSVFTLAGAPGALCDALLSGASAALERIDMRYHEGLHPCVGALDVAPIVYLNDEQLGSACAHALVLGDRLGAQLDVPVFLYGRLADGRTRAQLRRGGVRGLAARVRDGELAPDFGPRRIDLRSGATLVGARPPLVAFNLELAPPADLQQARRIAAAIREGGEEGLPGVRALGLWLDSRAVAQVSTNIEDPVHAGPAEVLAAVQRHAEVSECELIGLAPRAAFAGFGGHGVPVRGLRLIEDALEQAGVRLQETVPRTGER
jgi:glutamate formiminotransferase